MNSTTPQLYCKKCNTNKSISSFTPSQFKISNPVCMECRKLNNRTQTKEEKRDNRLKRTNSKKVNLKDIDITVHSKIEKYFELSSKVDITFDSQYIDFNKIKIDISTPTAIQSVMGTGKTKYVQKIISLAREQGKTVCYCCPNISTIEDTREQLREQGITVSGYKDNNILDVVLTTIDSIDKFIDKDILIVDEVYSVFEELSFKSNLSSNSKLSAEIETRYRRILQHQNVFILDRFIGPVLRMFDAFQLNPDDSKKTEHTVIQNTYKKAKEILINNFKTGVILQEITDEIDLNDVEILIQSSEARTVTTLSKKLHLANIENTPKTANVNKSMSTKEFNLSRVKLSSPVNTRGVSLSADKVWIIDPGRTVGVVSMVQMTDRARHSKVINIRVSNGFKQKNLLLDEYNKLVQCDLNNRITRFIRMSDFIEQEHKEVYLYLLKKTYKLK